MARRAPEIRGRGPNGRIQGDIAGMGKAAKGGMNMGKLAGAATRAPRALVRAGAGGGGGK